MKAVDAHDVRDWMTRLRVASLARAGVNVSADVVERQVVADCELADAARRSGDIAGEGGTIAKDSRPALAQDRDGIVERAAQDRNLRVTNGGNYERFKLLHGNPLAVSPRWANACARIKRILETVNTDTSDLVKAIEGAELSALAKEAAEIISWWFMRHSRSPRNPYRELSTRDALRKYERLVYDVCDRSTGKLGHWYVK